MYIIMMNKVTNSKKIDQHYQLAKETYASLQVDTDLAMERLKEIPISLHCWQGDDVGGFERPDATLGGGGILATGNYPGKARTIDELRSDLEKVFSLLPSKHRLSLHASYLDNGGKFVDRNEIRPEHFHSWIDWALDQQIGLDFNPTYFSHPMAESGFTLSSPDEGIRNFWIDHGIASREIAAAMGKRIGTACVNNTWIPDGYKDVPVDRRPPRERLVASLDKIIKQKQDPAHLLDSFESKLFGIGSESYVVGSHDFYLGYCLSRNQLLCMDAGHYHPTEVISDKISANLMYMDELLLHVSRPVRWDSDHVIILNDELQAIAQEVVRGNFLGRVHIGLDFFDASINRVAAWTLGTRCMIKALLLALLEPIERLRQFERTDDWTSRLALLEELKTMPFGAVWDYYCVQQDVSVGMNWLEEVKTYENSVLSQRS
jgi:L-rhamnose isomerase